MQIARYSCHTCRIDIPLVVLAIREHWTVHWVPFARAAAVCWVQLSVWSIFTPRNFVDLVGWMVRLAIWMAGRGIGCRFLGLSGWGSCLREKPTRANFVISNSQLCVLAHSRTPLSFSS